MFSRGMLRTLYALTVIGGIWFGGASAQADTLYFQATPDSTGRTNFSWLRPNNWYTLDAMLQYQHANTIPGAGDEAILVTPAELRGNRGHHCSADIRRCCE